MAIYGDDIKTGKVNDIFCDAASDISDLPAFAEEHDLRPGSSCLCVDESVVYQMKSDNSWKAI